MNLPGLTPDHTRNLPFWNLTPLFERCLNDSSLHHSAEQPKYVIGILGGGVSKAYPKNEDHQRYWSYEHCRSPTPKLLLLRKASACDIQSC
jgi:hypothetical protein